MAYEEVYPDELEWYKSDLDSHILASRLAYQGESSTAYAGDYFGRHPSLIGPPRSEGVWYPEDKALFFASLSRYSRLRPDLIAEACGKSEVEVGWYLEILERGDQRLRNWDSSRHGARDRYDTWRKSRRSRIGLAPSAREVDGDWVEEEEGLASALMRSLQEEEGELRKEEMGILRGRELRKVMKEGMKQVGVKRKRDWERWKQVEQELEDKWEAEDWGMELDEAKLKKVEMALRDVANLPPTANGDGGRDSREEVEVVKQETKSGVTRTEDKIQHDAIRLARLEEIPKKRRSSEEKAEMREIKNRTRMRHAKRRTKLLEKGHTQEEIEEKGVDELFAEIFEAVGTSAGEDKDRTRVPIALPGFLADMGLEALNLDHIRQAQELINPSPPDLSLEILEELVLELRTFLTCLIYQVISLAEQDGLNAGSEQSDDDEMSASDDAESDSKGITSNHVYKILALRVVQPKDAIQGFLSRLGSLPPAPLANVGPALRPPASLPWKDMARSNPSPLVSSKSSTTDPDEMSMDEMDEEDDLTDQEDAQLDEALEELDVACDAKLADQLVEGEWIEEWWDDPWKEGNVIPETPAVSDTEGVNGDGAGDRGDDFQRARRKYTRLLFSIVRARRERSSRAFQREKYAHLRTKNRSEQSQKWIVSDDSESAASGASADEKRTRRRRGRGHKKKSGEGRGWRAEVIDTSSSDEGDGDDEQDEAGEEWEDGRRKDGWGPGSSADPSSGSEGGDAGDDGGGGDADAEVDEVEEEEEVGEVEVGRRSAKRRRRR